jgi:hypothetical protein
LDYLTSTYNSGGVVASVLIASFASYVTLDLIAKPLDVEAMLRTLAEWITVPK